jgi:hyperosmotically inducible protein
MRNAVRVAVSTIASLALVVGIGCSKDRRSEVEKGAAGTAGTIEKTAKDAAAKTSEVMTDTWITASINTLFLGEDLLKGSDIDVDTNDHIVTLTGTVTTKAGRARAVEIARTAEGVTDVVDHLTIGKKAKPLPPKD